VRTSQAGICSIVVGTSQAGTCTIMVGTSQAGVCTIVVGTSQTRVCTCVTTVVAWQNFLDSGRQLLVVWSWCTVVLLVSMALAAANDTTSVLELVEGLHWQRGQPMMLSSSVVGFMNWHRCVDNLWLNSLLVDDWLNCLMHVMVDMLTSHSRGGLGRMGSLMCGRSVLELAKLSGDTLLCLSLVVVLDLPVDLGNDVVSASQVNVPCEQWVGRWCGNGLGEPPGLLPPEPPHVCGA